MDTLQNNWPGLFQKCQGHKRQRQIKEAKETLQFKAECNLVLNSKPEKEKPQTFSLLIKDIRGTTGKIQMRSEDYIIVFHQY